MKMSILVIFLFSFSIGTNAQKVDEIDLQKSKITWEGSKLFGFGGHEGTVNFKEGKIIKNNNEIIGGEFIIDMNSIKSNEEGTWVKDLTDHLKGKDFFDVKDNPISKLVFTKVKAVGDGYTQITADLTINKVTKSVFFVAKLNDANTQLETRLKIDRTDWNITYKSQGTTSIKDQIISDAIAFNVTLTF